jgi:hypothetical protein
MAVAVDLEMDKRRSGLQKALQLADQAMAAGDLPKAREQALAAQQLFPEDENARRVLSEIDAEVLRRRVERELNDIRNEIDDARANGQLQRALSLCRRYLEVHPEDLGVANVAAEIEATVNEKQVEELAEQARTYAQSGDLELVEKIAGRIRKLAPSSPRAAELQALLDARRRTPAGGGADAAGAGAHRRGQPGAGAGRGRGGPEARPRRRARARDPQPHVRGGRAPGQGEERAGRDAAARRPAVLEAPRALAAARRAPRRTRGRPCRGGGGARGALATPPPAAVVPAPVPPLPLRTGSGSGSAAASARGRGEGACREAAFPGGPAAASAPRPRRPLPHPRPASRSP